MITKTIKTAFFAILVLSIAAPISQMNAFGHQEDRLERIAELKQEHSDQKDIVKRLNLVEKWIKLENQGKADSPKAQKIMVKILADMPTTGQNVVDEEEGITPAHAGFHAYTGSSQSRFNCSTQGTDFGKVTGSITSYTGWSYLVGKSNYPSIISTGTVGNCTNTNFTKTVITYNDIVFPLLTCVQTITSSSTGQVGGTCSMFGAGSIILVSGNADYNGTWFAGQSTTFVVI